jgi:hypothetical protein
MFLMKGGNEMRKWTDPQKYLHIGGILGFGACVGLLGTVAVIGVERSTKILNLAMEIGPDKAINILQKAANSTNLKIVA